MPSELIASLAPAHSAGASPDAKTQTNCGDTPLGAWQSLSKRGAADGEVFAQPVLIQHGRQRAKAVPIDDIKTCVLAQCGTFTLADVMANVGGSPATVRKARPMALWRDRHPCPTLQDAVAFGVRLWGMLAGMRTNGGSGGRRRLWIMLGVVAVLAAFGAVRALTDDDVGGDGDCTDPEPVVDVKTHTEQALDPVNLPGQYDITVEGTITNAAEHPITIGSIDVAMATSPDARVYGSGNGAVVEPGESIEFTASGPVELTGSPTAIPDATSANVEWSYEDARDYVC